MKTPYILGLAAVASVGLSAQGASAQTAWIEDQLSEQCSAASRSQIAEGVRQNIEESIARSEASIKAPASVMDLSCMSDLMNANIDVFSQNWMNFGSFDVEGMINDVTGGLKSGLSMQTLSSGVERAICDFAQSKFQELTSGLEGSMEEITSGAQMPNFSDGFGLLNIGYNSGSTTIDGSSGTSGSLAGGDGTGAGPGFYPDEEEEEANAGGSSSGYTPIVVGPAPEQPESTPTLPGMRRDGDEDAPTTETEDQIRSIWSNISGGSN